MILYQIKNVTELLPNEIETILTYWQVEEWLHLSIEEFKAQFLKSEFHLLTDEQLQILCVARINFDFKIRVQDEIYEIAELVGLVAIEKGKGYGKQLIQKIAANLKNRQIEAIGFCEKENRSFYIKCQIPIMFNQAKQLREPAENEWQIPTDDDLLNISLSPDKALLFQSLSPKKLGFLLFS